MVITCTNVRLVILIRFRDYNCSIWHYCNLSVDALYALGYACPVPLSQWQTAFVKCNWYNSLSFLVIPQLTVAMHLHMALVIVPEECVSPIRRLIWERPNCRIHDRNPYLFPYGQLSKDHLVGWHEIQRVYLEANVAQRNLVTANRVRYHAATIHAASEHQQRQEGLL